MNGTASDLVEISGLDLETCEQIVSLFKEQTFILIEILRAKINVDPGDDVATLLHKLKGSSGNICATEIHELAKSAEAAYKDRNLDLLNSHLGIIEKALHNI